MYFYEILQEIMREKSLSIPEFARLTGLADSTIRSIISRKTKTVALEVAFKISKALNVSLEYLNGEESYQKSLNNKHKENTQIVKREYIEMAKELEKYNITQEDMKKIIKILKVIKQE